MIDLQGANPISSSDGAEKRRAISNAQRRELEERGLFLSDVLFTAGEIEPVRLEAARLCREAMSLEGRSLQQRIRPFLPAAHTQSEILAAFARHPVFQELTREVVGPDVDQVWSQVCVKLPDEDGLTVFPFHQDSKFAKVEYRTGGFACFLSLGPLTLDNGTLHFAAGAHKSALDHEWNQRANWWECSVDQFEVVPGVLEPGQMVVYHPMTPHGSPPNRTSLPREALLLGFGPPEVRLDTGELFGDQRPLLRGGAPVW